MPKNCFEIGCGVLFRQTRGCIYGLCSAVVGFRRIDCDRIREENHFEDAASFSDKKRLRLWKRRQRRWLRLKNKFWNIRKTATILAVLLMVICLVGTPLFVFAFSSKELTGSGSILFSRVPVVPSTPEAMETQETILEAGGFPSISIRVRES